MDDVSFPSEAEEAIAGFSDLHIFGLGEAFVSTISKQVQNVYDAVQKKMRKWSNDFVVQRLLNLMVILNPRLNGRQQARLKEILLTVVDQLMWERSMDPRVIRGIIVLACPILDTGLLFGYLMEVIAGLACSSGHFEEFTIPKETHLDVESGKRSEEESKIEQLFLHHLCVEEVYVGAMPPKVKQAVFNVLNEGMDLDCQFQAGLVSSKQQPPPLCCITLEPLLHQDGTLTADVVAVIQKSSTNGKDHAFLYRGHALYDWLGHSQVPTNPETRSLVRPTDVYRLS